MKNIANFKIGPKHAELITQYEIMADTGYKTVDGKTIDTAFSDFELRLFRDNVRPIFQRHNARTVLDYGCGGSNWDTSGFDGDQSAMDFLDWRKPIDLNRREIWMNGVDPILSPVLTYWSTFSLQMFPPR